MDIQPSQFNNLLSNLLQGQMVHERKGEYIKAEKCRAQFEREKLKQSRKMLNELRSEHKTEQEQLTFSYNEDVAKFNKFWKQKMAEMDEKNERAVWQLSKRHQMQQYEERIRLERLYSLKVKESSELLNLRKMQAFTVKQKKYKNAHKIQQQINNLFQKEKNNWDFKRNLKIQTALHHLRIRQNTEMENLQKRINTVKDEQNKDRKIALQQLKQKYENHMNDLRIAQEKQILCFKGELKNAEKTRSSTPSNIRSRRNSYK